MDDLNAAEKVGWCMCGICLGIMCDACNKAGDPGTEWDSCERCRSCVCHCTCDVRAVKGEAK